MTRSRFAQFCLVTLFGAVAWAGAMAVSLLVMAALWRHSLHDHAFEPDLGSVAVFLIILLLILVRIGSWLRRKGYSTAMLLLGLPNPFAIVLGEILGYGLLRHYHAASLGISTFVVGAVAILADVLAAAVFGLAMLTQRKRDPGASQARSAGL